MRVLDAYFGARKKWLATSSRKWKKWPQDGSPFTMGQNKTEKKGAGKMGWRGKKSTGVGGKLSGEKAWLCTEKKSRPWCGGGVHWNANLFFGFGLFGICAGWRWKNLTKVFFPASQSLRGGPRHWGKGTVRDQTPPEQCHVTPQKTWSRGGGVGEPKKREWEGAGPF